MALFKTVSSDLLIKGELVNIKDKKKFDKFNESILGLGQIDAKSAPVNALSVIFDLEGFTNFCKQIDPQLGVPEYLSVFLKWIFSEIKIELIGTEHLEGYETYADLPFLSKFLGDGVLFLWNTEGMQEIEIVNIVLSMHEICNKYIAEFLPKISKNIISPPMKLRCGIARGLIYSIGNGKDYVGPCINMSARLQKLNSLTFCFSRRGINPALMIDQYKKAFLIKMVDIRGIGSSELVCLLKKEYDKLDPETKVKFID
jgi:hypothetical protein